MALAFLWFIPIAIFAAKFFRPFVTNSQVDHSSQYHDKASDVEQVGKKRWWNVHSLSNIIASALVIAGFTLGYYASGNSFKTGVKNVHFIVGLVVFIGILLQAIAGIAMSILSAKKRHGVQQRSLDSASDAARPRKPLLHWMHIVFGYLITLLGVANIWLGLQYHHSPHYLYALWIAAVAVWIVLYFVGLVVRPQVAKRHVVSKDPNFHSY